MLAAPVVAAAHLQCNLALMMPVFTLDNAQEIREDFEDLIDTEFHDNGVSYFVDELIIEPVEGGFDVVIVASDDVTGDKITIPIRNYIERNGINYNFPEAN